LLNLLPNVVELDARTKNDNRAPIVPACRLPMSQLRSLWNVLQ